MRCVALRGEGMTELWEALGRHREWVAHTEEGRQRRRERLAEEVRETLRESLIESASSTLSAELEQAVLAVERKELDPYTAIESLVARFRAR